MVEKRTQTEKHSVKLTEKEIASITSEKEIKAHIIGADYSDDNVFTIDIQESKGLPTGLYVNDLENQLIGNTAGLEWKYKEEDQWTSYKEEQPDLSGDKTLIVRTAATGVYLAGTTNTYQFTKDNTDDAQKYISIKHLSIEKVSSDKAIKEITPKMQSMAISTLYGIQFMMVLTKKNQLQ